MDADGFLHTGDVCVYDENGIFTVVDRVKELIKVKGFQVQLAYCCESNLRPFFGGFLGGPLYPLCIELALGPLNQPQRRWCPRLLRDAPACLWYAAQSWSGTLSRGNLSRSRILPAG